jgi:NTP pyrophosphatase (non-canonical NTP hydrolase)
VPDTDRSTTVSDLRTLVRDFVDARDWQQFHSPKNLSMALAIEAAELMEHFQWITPDASREIDKDGEKLGEVSEELADVLCYALAIANELNIDVATAMASKMKKNELKYPADEFRGRYGPKDQGSS